MGKRAKHETLVRRNPYVKLHLTDRTFLFTHLALHRFLISAPNFTFGPYGTFWAAQDVEIRRVQGNCGDILCQSFQFRKGFYCIHWGRGVGSRGGWRGSNHTQTLSKFAKFRRQSLLGEWKTYLAITRTGFPNLQGTEAIAPSQREIRR